MSDRNERACVECGSLLHHELDCPKQTNAAYKVVTTNENVLAEDFERAAKTVDALLGFSSCCGGSDEHPPEHTQDCDGREQEEWQRLRPLTLDTLPDRGRVVAVVYAAEGAPPSISTGAVLARYLTLYGSASTFRWRYATEAEVAEYEEEQTRWGATLISTVERLVQATKKL